MQDPTLVYFLLQQKAIRLDIEGILPTSHSENAFSILEHVLISQIEHYDASNYFQK